MLAHVKAFFEANESSRFESITPDPDDAERIYNRVGYWKIENGEKSLLCDCLNNLKKKSAKAMTAEKLQGHCLPITC